MGKFSMRLVAIFLTIAIFCLMPNCFLESKIYAQKVNTNDSNVDTNTTQGFEITESLSYYEYSEKNKAYKPAKTDFVIAGGDYSSEIGSQVQRLNEYEGKANVLKWDSQTGSVTYNFTLPENGLYNIKITYMQLKCRGNDIRFGVKIDGEYLFDGMEETTLPRLWRNDGEVRTDAKGDQLSPEQVELFTYTTQPLKDKDGIVTKPYEFAISAGDHSITFEMKEEAFVIACINFTSPENVQMYTEVSQSYNSADYYNGTPIVIQGEDACIKTSNSLIAKSDNSAHLTPSSAYNLMINYIGSTNWDTPGETLTWKVHVPDTGLYKLGFKYKQSDLVNGVSYRYLKIDGQTPFSEAEAIPFDYDTSWQVTEYSNENEEPYLFHLTSGDHEISLDVTLAETSEFYRRLQQFVTAIGDEYIKINMITGENPDANRNYDLFKQIPNFNERLQGLYEGLDKLSVDMQQQSGKRSSSIIAAITNMSRVLKSMVNNPYTAQQYKSDYYTCYSSLSSWLYEMKAMPLSIDEILLTSPKYDFEKEKIGIIKSIMFSIVKFISSFASDYAVISDDDENTITIWANWGLDQTQILQTLIRESFTKTTGIDVNLQMVNAGIVKGILSGNPPDLELRMSRTEPVNLAMRGVQYDLTQFDDFDEVVERFQPTAIVPYQYNGGCYALPDTQSFYIMYYRTDIFEQLGLEVPTTWEEFLTCATTIQRKKMQVWLPYTQISTTTTVNTGIGGLSIFPTLIAQNGLSLYNEKLNGSSLNTAEVISVFNYWTDFYTEYKIPKEASFYNRFRVGTMPLGIENYTLYRQLFSVAPEIKGRWQIAPLPGVKRDDGTINNVSTGSGTGAGIVAGTGKEELAWEFLKWWTSSEIQMRYSNNLESVLGPIGRIETANIEAASNMAWSAKDFKVILEQWNNVVEVNEIPGSYYLTRALDQAFWNVTNGMYTAKDAMLEWSRVADNEIKRKIKEYNP